MVLSVLRNTPRLYTALAEWGACLIYIIIRYRKPTGVKFAFSLAVFFFLFAGYQTLAGTLPLYFWIPSMLGAALLMYLFLFLFTDDSWIDTGFCCIRAFVLAEFTASLHRQLYAWWAVTVGRISPLVSLVTMIICYTAVYLIYYFMEKDHIPKDERMNVNGKELSSAAFIGFTAFAMSNLSFITQGTPFSGTPGSILYVRTLVDFGGLVMLFSQQDKREEFRMRSENQSMNAILQRQYDQYRLSVDNMELLRREFHDLKHYLIAIRAEEDPEKKERYFSEMEDAILAQEALNNTGNSVLDVVLTSKSTYCARNGITFTCMADGKQLSFMHVKDICSIFGNALDNAIECVSQFSDPEKRLITLSMFKKNHFLMIQCENYTETPILSEKNRLPSTTKTDTQLHGYGLKSIQHAAGKYGGSMTIHAEDNWFRLQILIPVSEKEHT